MVEWAGCALVRGACGIVQASYDDFVLLERLFENLALSVEPFAECVVSSGWRLRMDPLEYATLHFVLRGRGELRLGSGASKPLGEYSLALVPQQRTHVIQTGSKPFDEAPPTVGDPGHKERLQFVAGPDGDRELLIACGRLQAVYAGGFGLFDLMDDAVVIDFADSEAMKATFARMLEESQNPSPGGRAMMTALMNECLVLLFRRLCGSPECGLPWLDALEDPRMTGPLGAILERPENPHTLDSLAAKGAMSRSAFATEFAARFGRTPMAFLREVRLRKAAQLLRGTNLPVEVVSRRIGFSSRSHFSRAFHEYFGRSPSEFRNAAA